jgi:hypothetical protein
MNLSPPPNISQVVVHPMSQISCCVEQVLFGTAIHFPTHYGNLLNMISTLTKSILHIRFSRFLLEDEPAARVPTLGTPECRLPPRILNPIPLRHNSCPLRMPRKLHTILKVIQKLNQRPPQPPRQRSLVRRHYRRGIPAPRMDPSCS